MKIAADDARVIPAEAKARLLAASRPQGRARSKPTDVGMALWKTIAPVMLPRASVSLPGDPQHAVELLRQLRGDRGDQQRQKRAVDAE
jgi:hypothetical protein